MHLSLLSFFSIFIYCTTYNCIHDQGKMVVSLTINNHNDKKENTSKYEITYTEKSTMTRLNIFE